MKNAFKLLALVLVICFTCSLMSCDLLDKFFNKDDGGKTANQNVVAIAGDYILDGSDYGMAMQWFIQINADETFKISTKNDYSVDKGNGTVKESAGTFMFLYSDSTTENPKTATFTVVNGNLVFSTAIPVGTVNFRNQNEDSDGTVVVYPAATVPSVVGSFAGELDKAGMGGVVHYDFTFDVKANGTYKYTSTFAMSGDIYYYGEEGTISIKDSVVTIKALKNVTSANMETGTLTDIAADKQAEVVGSIADNVISIKMKPAPMSSTPADVTFTLVPSYAGTYTGSLDKAGMGGANTHYDFSLEIKYNGTFKYTSTFTMMGSTYVYGEEGTCSVANGYAVTLKALKKVTDVEAVTFSDIDAADQVEVNGTIAMGGKLTISMKTSPMAPAATELTLEQQ